MKEDLSFIIGAEKTPFIKSKSKRAVFTHDNSPVSNEKKKRKEDALELAQLIYDVFVEQNRGHTIVNGQTDANPTTSN